MEAIVYLLSRFSAEALAAQVALISLVCCLSLYFYLLRRKKRYSSEWVPAALVKAYIDKVDHDEREIRLKLFGEDTSRGIMPTAFAPTAVAAPAPVQQIVVQGADPAVMKELEALRAQLGVADSRAVEFNTTITQLKAQNTALEEKLKAAPTAAAAPAAGASEAATKELENLKAKLAEYEVIEDDLANLKKYQIENKALQEKLSTYEKGGAPAATTVAPAAKEEAVAKVVTAAAPEAEAKTVIKGGVAETAPTLTVVPSGEAKVEKPVEVAPAPAVAAAPAASPAPAVAAPAPAAAAPAGDPKAGKEKEQDLLSEFEKMLAS